MAFSLVDLQVLAKSYAFPDGQWKTLIKWKTEFENLVHNFTWFHYQVMNFTHTLLDKY